MELEKVKTIVYTSCVAVLTLVASACLIKFTISSTRTMDRCGTKFEECGTKFEKIEDNLAKASENLAKVLDETATVAAGFNSNKLPEGDSKNGLSKSGGKGDDVGNFLKNIGAVAKNVAEISQFVNEKFKDILDNVAETCERANNGVKSVPFLDTRTDEEKSEEEEKSKKAAEVVKAQMPGGGMLNGSQGISCFTQ